uniref:Uncharacterized protein n=1 Tax=Amphimedon queenslandica TaxID=400682 RepID=A0A1X7VB43_AMPQE
MGSQHLIPDALRPPTEHYDSGERRPLPPQRPPPPPQLALQSDWQIDRSPVRDAEVAHGGCGMGATWGVVGRGLGGEGQQEELVVEIEVQDEGEREHR